MGRIELLLLAVALSMDAFSVAVCKGLAMKKITVGKMAIVGLWFGVFQALMPVIGYFLGSSFADYITSIDHWIAFVLLLFIGGNMIREAFSKGDDKEENADLGFLTMLLLAVATSIDALAVGVTFAFIKVNVWFAVSVIGLTTFILSFIGVKIGSIFGAKYKSRAELVGGIILILIGTHILLQHLGVINF